MENKLEESNSHANTASAFAAIDGLYQAQPAHVEAVGGTSANVNSTTDIWTQL